MNKSMPRTGSSVVSARTSLTQGMIRKNSNMANNAPLMDQTRCASVPRERPILFNGAMVRAVLAGDKIQTRRTNGLEYFSRPENDPDGWLCARVADGMAYMVYRNMPHERPVRCPYGQPGDRLWVREAFRFAASLDRLSPNDVGEKALDAGYNTPWAPTQFEADGTRTGAWRGFDTPPAITAPGKLRPGIHMPRWACRLALDIVRVRVERLQAINHFDALAEGVGLNPSAADVPMTVPAGESLPRAMFRALWEQINGAESWQANPWVWVVEFRRSDQ